MKYDSWEWKGLARRLKDKSFEEVAKFCIERIGGCFLFAFVVWLLLKF